MLRFGYEVAEDKEEDSPIRGEYRAYCVDSRVRSDGEEHGDDEDDGYENDAMRKNPISVASMVLEKNFFIKIR